MRADAEMESGRVEYGPRAFRQDAHGAVRTDIVRGLIELITNSDDAYDELGSCRPGSPGKIIVEVEHRRKEAWRVVVRDRATGMTREEMKERLATLGGRTSGFESGRNRRGNLGRGAKDLAAFGDTTFTSIHEGRISTLILDQDGDYHLSKRDRTVTKQERDELGIKHNGTVVTVAVQPNFQCPQHAALKRRLESHFQLRDLLSDPLRRVELLNLNPPYTRDPLIYTYPDVPVVFDDDIVLPDYPDVSAHLVIWRHPERCEDGTEKTGRPTGILIKGQRAIYENTLFGFEGNINATWFSGKLDCPHIDVLAREYDDAVEGQSEVKRDNPMRIISRQRDGLEKEHPFYQALRTAAEGPLGMLVKQEQDKLRQQSSQAENDETRHALAKLSREVSRLLDDAFREIEAEEPPGDGAGEHVPLLALAPEQGYAYLGEDRTLVVHARADGISAGDAVSVEVDPKGVLEVLTERVDLRPHEKRPDVLTGRIRLRPLVDGQAVIVAAEVAGRTAEAILEVRESRVIEVVEVEPPETLEFEHSRYRVGWQRRKDIHVVAPAALVADHGTSVQVISSKPEGVCVRAGQVDLEYDDELDYYAGTARVEARELHAKAVLTARLGPLSATAQVTVTRKESGPKYEVRLAPTEYGIFRAMVEPGKTDSGDDVQVINIAAQHPVIRPYLGDNYEGQNSYVVMTMYAEIVADVAANLVLQKLFAMRHGVEMFDAARMNREHAKLASRFLPVFYRVMVGEPGRAQTMGIAHESPVKIDHPHAPKRAQETEQGPEQAMFTLD